MLTIFRDIKTNEILKYTYKFENLFTAVNKKKFKYKNRLYIAIRYNSNIIDGIYKQEIDLLSFPDKLDYEEK